MNILLLGSGGREHAIAWKIAQSPKVDKLFIAPGNAGTKEVGENVAISVCDFDAIASFVLDNGVSMVVVGPEDPLVKGIYDYFKADDGTYLDKVGDRIFAGDRYSCECGGKGCSLCKGTGWIEVLGAGIVNKKVLEVCNIDSEKYSGLAFGIGMERLAMLKYGINNIKLLFESDVRVLNQLND